MFAVKRVETYEEMKEKIWLTAIILQSSLTRARVTRSHFYSSVECKQLQSKFLRDQWVTTCATVLARATLHWSAPNNSKAVPCIGEVTFQVSCPLLPFLIFDDLAVSSELYEDILDELKRIGVAGEARVYKHKRML